MPKISTLGQKMWPIGSEHTNRHTDTQTDTQTEKANTPFFEDVFDYFRFSFKRSGLTRKLSIISVVMHIILPSASKYSAIVDRILL